MIDTVAQLLNEFKNKEIEMLRKYHIVNHPTIIGSMYENLTKEILHKSLFKDINLRVASGKIKNEKTNGLSLEIDCMLVYGEGDKIPYTDKHIYDSSQVIAVIEVKKNLFSRELKDSYQNLLSVLNTIDYESRQHDYYHTLHKGVYKVLCHEELYTKEELEKLPIEKQMIYHSLALEAYLPLRIVWGYEGFKSEFNLRESFVKYLESSIPEIGYKKGFSPLSIPSLVICNNYSLIKNNGIPFAYPITDNNLWKVYASSNYNPVYFFLEIIWTKLHFMFGISSEIFGEDMRVDSVHNFLDCEPVKIERDDVLGWNWIYREFPEDALDKPLSHRLWEPTILTYEQFVILQLILKDGSVSIDGELIDFLLKSNINIENFLLSISKVGLFYVRDNQILTLYENFLMGITTDGRYFADDNSTGKVSRWIETQIKTS